MNYQSSSNGDIADRDATDHDFTDNDTIDNGPEQQLPDPETVQCHKCGLENQAYLIYCVNRTCIAPLSRSTRSCPCGHLPPYNVNYCPQCGVRLPPLVPQT